MECISALLWSHPLVMSIYLQDANWQMDVLMSTAMETISIFILELKAAFHPADQVEEKWQIGIGDSTYS